MLVDDEPHITDLLKYNLEGERYAVTIETTASRVAALDLNDFRLVIADAMQQPYTGMDLLCDIKANPITARIPVIILSHNDSEDAVIEAFDQGADDYIFKPFSLRELVARIRSVLRRSQLQSHTAKAPTTLKFGSVEVDIATRQVRDEGMLVPVTKTEYAILSLLLKNKNKFFNRAQIFDHVWRDPDNNSNDRIVDTNISRLRKKLGPSASLLVNRTGQGYAIIDG